MKQKWPLTILSAAGAALCWWPAMVEPSIDFPRWILLALVSVTTGLAVTLSSGRWFRLVSTSTAGAFVGLCGGSALFPPSDGIAATYVPFAVVAATLGAFLVSLLAGLTARKFSLRNEVHRRAAWFGLACCVAFGPVMLAVTPPLVACRVARNDRIAAERFRSLKNAGEKVVAETGSPGGLCDGQAWKQHYSGPPFNDQDWQRIAGNYVQQDGYCYMVYCHENGGYTINAYPLPSGGYGTRHWCTDESGKIGCDMQWNRSRNACVACPK